MKYKVQSIGLSEGEVLDLPENIIVLEIEHQTHYSINPRSVTYEKYLLYLEEVI